MPDTAVQNGAMHDEHTPGFQLRAAEARDVAAIVGLIRELAEFEKLTHLLQVTPETLHPHLFGAKPVVEAMVGEVGAKVVSFALYFTNFSTFLAKPGLYLEDLYVQPAHRGSGIGRALLERWARLRSSVDTAASNGACSTGTKTRFASTRRWVPW